ncbi:hypothetical protein LCGC14_2210310, partial [marine sediment metagenome]
PRAEDGKFAAREEQSSEEQAEEASSETPEVPVTPETWGYAADGQRYDVGTVLDGVLSISADQVPHIQQLLSEGRHHQGNWQRERQESQRQVEAARAEVTAAEATRQSLMDEFERVANLGEDELADYMAGLRSKWPQIKSAAEAKGADSRNSAVIAENEQYKREKQERELEPQVLNSLETEMVKIRESDQRLQVLTQQDMQLVFGRLSGNVRGLMVTDQSLPWQGEGTPWLDIPQVTREMEYVASLRGRQTKQESTTEAAKKSNAAELTETKAPPAVKATTTATSASSPAKRFKPSKGATAETVTEEMDDFFDAMEV